MKRIFLSGLALLCLTGCSSQGLVHDKAYLRAAAVSSDSGTDLTLAFFTDEEPVTVDGSDMAEALREAELRLGKEIFTGFTELVILDREDEHDAENMEHMLKDWKVAPECIVAYSGSGASLLKKETPELLGGMVKEAVRQGRAPESGLVNVLGEYLREGSADAADLDVLYGK
jgi:hypothetical protein